MATTNNTTDIEEYADWCEDNSFTDDVPDFVQQYADKCDREETAAKEEQMKVAVIGGVACAAFIAAVFYCCWKYYVG